ncbi:1500_t:CDS:2 [Gigaspora margarita]|uniref:1500_t:CDS:1 n=1 Tax=Gigaspora margarita TaxID=4874 RepID=A0ABN7W6F0_GIGMA|nr:1500_t:CDS:2 [Gigaspora margarita]
MSELDTRRMSLAWFVTSASLNKLKVSLYWHSKLGTRRMELTWFEIRTEV